MDAVFRIADRITVMVNGAVIASGARRHPHSAAVQAAYLGGHDDGQHELLLDARGCTPGTAAATCCTASTCRSRAARRWACSGRNGMGKSTLIRTLLGHVTQRDGASSCLARRVARTPHEMARLAWPTCPRAAACSPT
jgi:ABC-type branched-subunit amino acid transport system ATPase component